MAKTNVQTNLLGRTMVLSEENAKAAQRYLDAGIKGEQGPPWLPLYPNGGEVVAVFTDRDGTLNITTSTADKLVTLEAAWLRLAEPSDVLGDIRALVDYSWRDEERDYEDCSNEDGDNQQSGHIFERLQNIDKWLSSFSA